MEDKNDMRISYLNPLLVWPPGFSGRKCFCIPMANTRNEDGQGGRNKRVSTVELSLVHTKSWQNPKEIQVG